MIVIGADTHKGTHALAAVDEGTGRVRGSRQIKADDAGHLAAVRWARELDPERVWAIEDCRHVSGRLEQALIATLRSAPEPIRPEVARLVARLRARWSTEAALRALAGKRLAPMLPTKRPTQTRSAVTPTVRSRVSRDRTFQEARVLVPVRPRLASPLSASGQ